MSIAQAMLAEFEHEAKTTRKFLERIPQDKLGWRPHQKSRALGELAMHVANIPGMAERIAKHDEFSPTGGPPPPAGSAADIVAAFESNLRTAEEALGSMSEQAALGNWRLTFKGKEIFTKPRVAALRTNMLNHMYHHRGQLTVYLRLNDETVPAIYGPSADEGK